MIRFAPALSAFALIAAVPAAAQEAARDFQLPPAPAPTQDNRVQGPVDTEGVVPIRPRAIQTATPTPSPAATAAPAPAIVLPSPTPTRTAGAARTPAPASPNSTTRAPATGAPSVSTPLPPIAQPTPAPAPPVASIDTPASPLPAPAAGESDSSLPWLWIALGLLAATGAAFLLLRRRRAEPETPTILAPLAAPGPVANGQLTEALAISVEAVRMDRSVMNATVGYRVTLRNRTTQALSMLAIEADLVSASKDRPAEAQLASRDHALTPRHTAERLAPGQSLRFEGQVRLPLAEASAIWQGRVGLLVPLLKVRATAAEAHPIATTLVIGRREGTAARPQPFRLDEPPRSYAPLAQRVLDAVPTRA